MYQINDRVEEIAYLLGVKEKTVKNRLLTNSRWSIEEVAKVCDYYNDIHALTRLQDQIYALRDERHIKLSIFKTLQRNGFMCEETARKKIYGQTPITQQDVDRISFYLSNEEMEVLKKIRKNYAERHYKCEE